MAKPVVKGSFSGSLAAMAPMGKFALVAMVTIAYGILESERFGELQVKSLTEYSAR